MLKLFSKKLVPLLALCYLLFHGSAFSYAHGSGVKLVSSDANGVLLELKLDDLTVESEELDGKGYHLISYDGCAFTSEVGRPRLPVSRVSIGVPPSASISINIVNSQFSDLFGHTLLPVPKKVQRTSPGGMEVLAEEFALDKEFYRRNVLYPSENAVLIYEGYIRHQRVAVIELRPVQYNPATKLLRKYSSFILRVNFSSSAGTRQDSPLMSPSQQMQTDKLQDDKEFEKLYQGLLLNYDDARKWRKVRTAGNALAPAQGRAAGESEAFKIFVARSGIYRLDYVTLRGVGIDLSEVDPRTIKVRIRGSQVPIYVHGEADGKFDEEDYVEFFSAKPDSIYTRWNVYWLTWGGARGMRMTQRSGSLHARTAREVTFFKSVVRFEEDHLHHKLQNVRSDPDNPEGWFESRDHWFWDGIENGSAKNEVTVKFPVYDLAQTMVRPDFGIELVGCTDFEHRIMISINGYRIGEEAEWNSQDIYSFDGHIPANALRTGMNELRLTRIGSNPADGENTMTYPYQVYLNWFEAGYVRELLAVDDSLEFSAPEPKDPSAEEVNRYDIAGFLNGDIEIFQITDSNAVCRFKNVVVKKYELDQDQRDRIKAINSMQDLPGIERPISSIQNTAYRAIFEDRGRYSPQYIAVTPASVLRPERIEKDAPSNLRDPSNQADYIIISHPMFIDVANELADWRSGVRGGGFRTRVVDVTDIYDEFGFGMVSPKAIKDFLRFAYGNWMEPAPSYVLILADATYDFLGVNEEFYEEPPELIGFIPTFYFWTTFGQTAVDHWYSTIDGDDGFPDIYLGRIPVEDVSQAEVVLEKIIANESGNLNGPWRKQIISIADDDSYAAGDEMFREGLEEVWRDYTPLGYDTEKIYLKDIMQQVEQDPNETRRSQDVVQEKIINAFGNGAVIAQYSGHGGRHVWAHEIIFSIDDIDDLMKEANVYPFLLVLSCYNGYFDLPGELCMAEGMLRANRRGSVAMLSATRLTYGSGNVALNRLLFDGIFKNKLLRIGQVSAISKIRVVIEEGMSWLNQMREYTLFGDPASRLNIPDYEVHPQFSNAMVDPGGKLELRTGQVVTSVDGLLGSFDGKMTATVSFPDGRETSKTITVTKGNYPTVSFDVPANMASGEGQLLFYGENATETVVGGVKFSVGGPSFLSVSPEFFEDKLQFYAKVRDDVSVDTTIKSMTLRWSSPSNLTGTDSLMIFDQQESIYKLAQPISLSFRGGNLTYQITVEDLDGNHTSTGQQTVELPSRPNLTIRDQGSGIWDQGVPASLLSNPYSLSYSYSTQLQEWGINAQADNGGTAEVLCSVQIFAFGGDPDRNNDEVVDDDAQVLGQAKIDPEEWNDQGTTWTFIPLSLSMGRHAVFVWIDPEFNADHAENVFGACAERNEADNMSSRVLDITHVLLRPSQEGTTQSLDDVFHFSAPAGAVGRDEPIAIESIQDVQNPLNQPDVSFVALPGGQQGGYGIFSISDQKSEIENLKFHKPVSLQMEFDLASFKEKVKNEIGLGDFLENQLNTEQKELLEQALKERVSGIDIYLWHHADQKWSCMPSTPALDNSGNILRRVHNTAPMEAETESIASEADNGVVAAGHWLIEISIEEDADTPIDRWTIVFLDPEHFQLQGDKTGVVKKNDQPYVGAVGEEFYDQATGLKFTIMPGASTFAAGDELEFETMEVGIIQATSEWSGVFSLMLNRDSRPPDIHIDVSDQNFADGDVVASEPTIHALISDDNGVDVLARSLDIGISTDGGLNSEPASEDDYVLHWDTASNLVSVNYWPGKLDPGEYEVRFQAYDFNGNLGAGSIRFIVKGTFELTEVMNYPNPFERETDIAFKVTSLADEAIVKIYTVSGRLIRTLEHNYPINLVVIHWDGRDEDGEEVANGVYYYKLRLKREDGEDITPPKPGKMMKLK